MKSACRKAKPRPARKRIIFPPGAIPPDGALPARGGLRLLTAAWSAVSSATPDKIRSGAPGPEQTLVGEFTGTLVVLSFLPRRGADADGHAGLSGEGDLRIAVCGGFRGYSGIPTDVGR